MYGACNITAKLRNAATNADYDLGSVAPLLLPTAISRSLPMNLPGSFCVAGSVYRLVLTPKGASVNASADAAYVCGQASPIITAPFTLKGMLHYVVYFIWLNHFFTQCSVYGDLRAGACWCSAHPNSSWKLTASACCVDGTSHK